MQAKNMKELVIIKKIAKKNKNLQITQRDNLDDLKLKNEQR